MAMARMARQHYTRQLGKVTLMWSGLTGTPCRCGPLFCAAHIHDHGCTYDYKAEAVAELRRNNPVISPPKVTKF